MSAGVCPTVAGRLSLVSSRLFSPRASQTETQSQLASRDFTPWAPRRPFRLTQIEMADSFPLDSSTCESRTCSIDDSGRTRTCSGARLHLVPGSGLSPGSDDAFQKLLLRIAAKAGERADADSLIQLFCRATREFFQVSGVYFWRRQPGDELVGEQADGKLADRFRRHARASRAERGHGGSSPPAADDLCAIRCTPPRFPQPRNSRRGR